MTKKVVKIVAVSLAGLIGAFVLVAGVYLAYVALQYYRIDDNLILSVENARETAVSADSELSVMTYNLGFASYSQEYSFFMDEGVMNDGEKTVGIYAKGMNKADVRKNVDGQISVVKSAGVDFYFLQEVDEKAHRSYKINMRAEISTAMDDYCSIYAENFHTAYLLYPFNDPMGTTNAGMLTLSKYCVDGAVRRSFPLTDKFIEKLTDLDRCFSVHYLPVDGSDKKLVMINLHMSAYDKGGTVRAKQLEMLNAVLKEEYEKGNYVVAGGDFNHCLIADYFDSDEEALSHFPSNQQTPEWMKNSVLHASELTDGFNIAADKDVATCRGADIPYEKGVNYTTTLDGFLYSDNVEVVSVNTVDTEYEFSDHNPVTMRFKLKV